MNEKQPLAPDRIMQFAWGYAPTLAIEAAVQHEIFDILEKGPRTVEQLAEETGASVRGLTAILNLLVGLQLLGRDGPRYLLTPESAAFLVSSQPRYHGMFFKHISDQLLPNWLQLSQIVRTGQPATKANDQNEGAEFFAKFVESLFPISFAAANALGEHLGIPKVTRPLSVLDIGAGSGVWGIALAKQSPHVRVRAVDWPRVLGVFLATSSQWQRLSIPHSLELTTSAFYLRFRSLLLFSERLCLCGWALPLHYTSFSRCSLGTPTTWQADTSV